MQACCSLPMQCRLTCLRSCASHPAGARSASQCAPADPRSPPPPPPAPAPAPPCRPAAPPACAAATPCAPAGGSDGARQKSAGHQHTGLRTRPPCCRATLPPLPWAQPSAFSAARPARLSSCLAAALAAGAPFQARVLPGRNLRPSARVAPASLSSEPRPPHSQHTTHTRPSPHLQVVQQLEELLLIRQRLLPRGPRSQQRAGLAPHPLNLRPQRLVGLQASTGLAVCWWSSAVWYCRSVGCQRSAACFIQVSWVLELRVCSAEAGRRHRQHDTPQGKLPPPRRRQPASLPALHASRRTPTAQRRSVSARTPAARASNSAACLPSSSSHLASSPVMK